MRGGDTNFLAPTHPLLREVIKLDNKAKGKCPFGNTPGPKGKGRGRGRGKGKGKPSSFADFSKSRSRPTKKY